MRAAISVLGAAVLGVGLWGCESTGVSFSYHDHDPPRRHVHVAHGHVCGHECAHYWSGDGYVVVTGHVHGPGCGHVLTGGRWIVHRSGPTHVHVEPTHVHVHETGPAHVHRVNPPPRRVVTVEHVHGPHCGCVFDRSGSKWLVVGKDHVHGPGCGHVYIEGRWTIRY